MVTNISVDIIQHTAHSSLLFNKEIDAAGSHGWKSVHVSTTMNEFVLFFCKLCINFKIVIIGNDMCMKNEKFIYIFGEESCQRE